MKRSKHINVNGPQARARRKNAPCGRFLRIHKELARLYSYSFCDLTRVSDKCADYAVQIKTAFRNSTADALSATNGGVSTPALQLASYSSCMPGETTPEERQDAQ
eukprot:6174748-Pleurochrysis_carterae.AAC.1